ncbi:phage integrase SAM-like domain-containing protein, partial [Phocaeicola dorei]|uniref:phage integrase SAM-like domain-containing protein n=1 Tax=Phocaeicola dorei TaxID=357276 RepID=UPI0035673B10
MGRVKSLSNSGSFVLRKDNQNAKGEYQVYIQYSLDRKIAKDKTDVWVKEKEWNDKAQKVRSVHPQSVRLNKILDKKKNDIDALILDFPSEKRLTIDVLRSMVKGEYNVNEEKNQDFVQLAIDYLETLYKTDKIGISVRNNGLNGLGLFRTFLLKELGEDSISIADMTEDIIDSYIIWRKNERNNINATINKALTPLMKAAKLAARKELMSAAVADAISNKYLPIKTKLSDEDVEDMNVRYLTEEQLAKFVYLYDKVKYPRTREIMDMFLFAFHACGLRFSDVLTLQWRHINFENKKISKVLYWKIQCKLPPKTKRFCPLKTFNNAP